MRTRDELQCFVGVAALLIATAAAASWFLPDVSGSDLWWHLAAGREIWAHAGPVREDLFSYTALGRPWLNPYFLWDAAYWWLYHFEPQSIAWLQWSVLAVTFAALYVTGWRASGSRLGAGISICVAAAVCHWFLDIRPNGFSLLFLAIVLLIRDQSWAPWLWAPLIALWANVHGGFAFGIGVIGLCVLVQTVERSCEARKVVILPGPWLGVGACLVAWMVNPWGPDLLGLHLHALDIANPSRADLIEWQSTPFSLELRDFEGRFWIMAILMLPGWFWAWRKQPELPALCAVTFAMAVTSRRFIPLFALTAAPLVAVSIGAAQRFLMKRVRLLAAPSAAFVACGASMIVALWLWQDVRLTPQLLERWTTSDRMPRAAVRYLNALGPVRVLNDYAWGGYIMLHAPMSRIFIDGRAEAVYDSEVYRDNRALRAVAPDFTKLLARYPADVALLPSGDALVRAMLQLPQPWRILYADASAVLLLSPYSNLQAADLPEVNEVLEGDPELDLLSAQAAQQKGELAQAAELVHAVLDRDPLNLLAHRQFILLYALARDPQGVERAVEAALQAAPNRWLDIRNAEGFAFLTMGDLPRSLDAYRRAIPRGPFRSRESALQRVAWLEQQIR